MNSSLDRLVKNLSDEDFKYLVKEFGHKNLEILKQKCAYPYEYMNSFERFHEVKLSARKYIFSSTKKGKIDNDGKISDGHVSIEDYLMCEKIWDKFEMKNLPFFFKRRYVTSFHFLKNDFINQNVFLLISADT